jgi:hypothetical protein
MDWHYSSFKDACVHLVVRLYMRQSSRTVPNNCKIDETLFELNTLVLVDVNGCSSPIMAYPLLVKRVGVDVDVNSMFNDTMHGILKWSLRRIK